MFNQLIERRVLLSGVSLSDHILRLLCSHQNSDLIYSMFKQRSSRCRIPTAYEGGLLCCIVLCAPRYAISESTLSGYNNVMIMALWRAICSSLEILERNDSISLGYMNTLLTGRNAAGYEALVGKSSSSITMTRTDRTLLDMRTGVIEAGLVPTPYQDEDTTVVWCSKTLVYGSMSSYVFSLLEMRPLVLNSPTAVQCSHVKYHCVVAHDSSITQICLKCGMTGPCCLTIDVGAYHVALEHEQATCPDRFLDPACELPDMIRGGLDGFIHDHLTTHHESIISHPPTKKPIIHSRRYIVWGSVCCPGRVYSVSMVCPTLNFMTFRIHTDSVIAGDVRSSVSSVESELRRLRVFTKTEMRVTPDHEAMDYVQISGTLAHWYARRSRYAWKPVSCSIGSSVLQVNRIDIKGTGQIVQRLGIKIALINTLVQSVPEGLWCMVEFNSNKVVVKFTCSSDSSRGPTLTIGRNGGFQWMGHPRELCRCLHMFAQLVEHNIGSNDFVSVASQLPVDTRPVYPSGIGRSQHT